MIDQRRPQASIIIPTYNRAPFLERQLRSLAGQHLDREEFEVIVADDGSTDETRDVVRKFTRLLRINYVYQEDRGFRVARARNLGARAATSPLLIFLDAGTLTGRDFVQSHIDAHADDDRKFAVGFTHGYNPWQPYRPLAHLLEELGPDETMRRCLGDAGFQDLRYSRYERLKFDLSGLVAPWVDCWSGNLSVSTTDFTSAGGFDESFESWGGEDLELGYRLTKAGLAMRVAADAWCIEIPHDRDQAANDLAGRSNSWKVWDRHPAPETEIFGAMYGSGRIEPSFEHEYATFLAWREAAAPIDVRHEVRAAITATRSAAARVAVIGCGAVLEDMLPRDSAYTLIDFDAEFIGNLQGHSPSPRVHALGIRTPLRTASHDLVIVTSRLRGLWKRWGPDILQEAERIGTHTLVSDSLKPTDAR
ncbi:glycosyltransferase [Actinokineospora diospyrosa]|uniref:Glycosyltransferase, GT2 family n=1 Tax=Actinokineospora diospyrosa TaxID=103728 RepID=A0ABT1I5J3_9PSEU|nr:glycosyltransferase [Actinokineospora diospyrosa]MCP2267898.1 Glycosyltransferase, GT2 family [Actinokineospora diospyrosa]